MLKITIVEGGNSPIIAVTGTKDDLADLSDTIDKTVETGECNVMQVPSKFYISFAATEIE